MRKMLLIVLLALCSCGGGGGGEPPVISIAGRWEGVVFSPTNEGEPLFFVTLDFNQEGDIIDGLYIATNGSDGRIDGTIMGKTISVSLSQINPCIGLFQADATLVDELNNLMEGTYIGVNGCGLGVDFGRFRANRLL